MGWLKDLEELNIVLNIAHIYSAFLVPFWGLLQTKDRSGKVAGKAQFWW